MFEEYLERAGAGTVTTQLLVVRARTRDNITITDPTDDTETHLRDAGFAVTRDDVQRALAKIYMLAREDNTLCICGSIPPGVTRGDLRSIIRHAHRKHARTVLDTAAANLPALRNEHLWLAKLNHKELAALADTPTDTEQQTIDAARALAQHNGGKVTHIVASRGAEGVIYIGPHHEIIGRVFVHPGRINSTVGSGDALLAGILHARYHQRSWPDAITKGLAAATANAVSRQPGVISTDDIQEFEQLATLDEPPAP
jgi:fructose-1-phosphate kinase PfkB-like protein